MVTGVDEKGNRLTCHRSTFGGVLPGEVRPQDLTKKAVKSLADLTGEALKRVSRLDKIDLGEDDEAFGVGHLHDETKALIPVADG